MHASALFKYSSFTTVPELIYEDYQRQHCHRPSPALNLMHRGKIYV